MAHISKHMFDRNIDDLTHNVLRSMSLKSVSWSVFGCLKGICNFFILMYVAQCLLLRKKLDKKDLKLLMRDFIQSVFFGYIFAATLIVNLGLQLFFLNKLNYYLTTFGAGIAMGLTSFLSPKLRLTLESTYFSILALECCIRYLSFIGILPRSKLKGIPYFMISNSLLMLLMWIQNNRSVPLNVKWIFNPFKTNGKANNKLCSHHGSCFKDCIKVTTKYFLIGGAASFAKILIRLLNRNSSASYDNLINWSLMLDPMFFASYVGLYKIIHCSLTSYRGEDCASHSALAGLISGFSYAIKPTLSLPASQTIIIVMALFHRMKKEYKISNLPYEYFSFILSWTVLLHFCIVNQKIASKFILLMVYIGTNGRSPEFLNKLNHFLSRLTI